MMSAELGYGIAAVFIISGLLFKFADWLHAQKPKPAISADEIMFNEIDELTKALREDVQAKIAQRMKHGASVDTMRR